MVGAGRELSTMDIKCPHCGTEYEVEKQDMYRYTKCQICSKGFVIGATTSFQTETSAHPTSSVASHSSWTPKNFGNTNVRDGRNDEAFLRQVNIYGYRERFIGKKNPILVTFDGGVREVPYRGNVTITSRVNEHILFSWVNPLGVTKDTEVVVGDAKNIVLALNKKDWSLHATKTNDVEKIRVSNSRKDTLSLIKAIGVLGFLIVVGLWAANEKWGLCEKIGDMFDDAPVDYLGRAHEPSYVRDRGPVEKIIDDAYKSQYGLDFTSGWYIKCPRCGTKLTTPSKRSGQKVKCIECKHTWKYK